MSSPRHRIHPKVIEFLHERGETVQSIADKAGTGRAHATQVMANKPGRGHHTRKKLARYLTIPELNLLGWDIGGNLFADKRPPGWFHAERSKPANISEPQTPPVATGTRPNV